MAEFCKACGSSALTLFAELCGVPKAAQHFLSNLDDTDSLDDSCDLVLYHCDNCGHVQSHAPLVSYYKDVITAASLSPRIVNTRLSILSKLSSDLGVLHPSVIEIGCYRGDFLDILNANGYTTNLGIESNIESVNYAMNRGLNVHAGYLLDSDFCTHLTSRFDVLCCFNFLEHIPNPFEFLQICRKLVKPNGFLYFTLPSFEFIRRTSCVHEFVADHVSYFSEKSLDLLFRRSMLNPVDISTINNGNDLQILAISQPTTQSILDLTVYNNLLDSFNEILICAANNNQTVAVWGAGHRTLTLISQINYSLISCIVDSAPFKVSKFSPVSHIQILSPDQYRKSPSSILILALPGIYCDEVTSELMSWKHRPSLLFKLGESSIDPLL